MCFGILQRSKIEALQKCHGNVKCVSEFSVIHIWVSEFECVLVMISSFHLHLETGVQNDAVTLITPQWQIYSLRCFKRFLSLFIVVFVRIIWCWCFCWCQLWMVGYNFFSHIFRILSSHTFSIFTSFYHMRTFFWCARSSHSPLFRVWIRRDFHIFIYFQNIFALWRTFLSIGVVLRWLFWFPIECSSFMSFCPAHIRAT